jgi:hypothetical protein
MSLTAFARLQKGNRALQPPGVVPRITDLDRLFNGLAGNDVTKLAEVRKAGLFDTLRTVVIVKEQRQQQRQRR